MKIDKEKCVGCEQCIKVCPMGAISLNADDKATINRPECVECGVCKRINICPTQAIIQDELSWPRSLRRAYSDPTTVFKETEVDGRGTEEMKTNDLTHKFHEGELGFSIDVGRPSIGTTFQDVEVLTKALASYGVQFEEDSPLTSLMTNTNTGVLQQEILDERVLSAIIEFKVPIEELEDILTVLDEASREIETVFSVGVISVTNNEQAKECLNFFRENNWQVKPNGKVNLGLARPD